MVDWMSNTLTESETEQVALDLLSELGYEVKYGPDIAPDGTAPERGSYSDVVLTERLRTAIRKINPKNSRRGEGRSIKEGLAIRKSAPHHQQSYFPSTSCQRR